MVLTEISFLISCSRRRAATGHGARDQPEQLVVDEEQQLVQLWQLVEHPQLVPEQLELEQPQQLEVLHEDHAASASANSVTSSTSKVSASSAPRSNWIWSVFFPMSQPSR